MRAQRTTPNAESVFEQICKRTNSPYSLSLLSKFRTAPKELVEADIDPKNYSDPATFAKDYLCYTFLRKYKGLKTGIDKRNVALLKFRKSEDKCAEMNRILPSARTTGRLNQLNPAILQRAQDIIARIWGTPTFSQLFEHCGWGPGSTSSLKGSDASREDKMSQFPVSCSRSAAPYFKAVIATDYLWLRHLFKTDIVGPTVLTDDAISFSDESRVITVSKDAKGDRTIGAEPTGNIYLQKGPGGYLRSRLKRVGIDLDDQSINQALASVAWVRGLVTLDLAAASDTVSIGAVKLLCPPEMFNLLNRLRSPSYRLNGIVERYHKFSSMGNGFTFELESLLFYAVCKAVEEIEGSGHPVGVYGDDLIVGADISARVVEFLNALGFEVNKDKSFFDGVFFESCGKHYFQGIDVTPAYQKHVIDGPLQYIRMTNRLFDWIVRMEVEGLSMRRSFGQVHAALLQRRPDEIKTLDLYGPSWVEGDGFFRVFTPKNVFDASNGYKVNYLRPVKTRQRLADGGLYADCMRISSVKKPKTFVESVATRGMVDIRPRKATTRFHVKTRWVPLARKR